MFAGNLVVQQNHVTGCFFEFRPVAFIRLIGEPVDLAPHQPTEFVIVHCSAIGAIQTGWLDRLRFTVKCAFVHELILMLREAEIRDGYFVASRYVDSYFILREIAARTAHAT